MVTIENIKVAIASIKDNLLRSLLTLMIIAVGIACLVGILTAIDSLLFTLSDNFNRLGANSFSIFPSNNSLGGREDGRQTKRAEPITYRQAMEFAERYSYGGARISIDLFCSSNESVLYETEKTDPTVRLIGVDENYLFATSYEIAAGRNFSKTEVESGSQKIIIGDDIVTKLFNGDAERAVGKYVSIGSGRFMVVGALEQKGSSSGQSNDKRVFIPLMNAKKLYGTQNSRYNITAAVQNPNEMDDAVANAVGVMRNVRNLKAADENDFEIRKSDSILNRLKEMTANLRIATIVIAMLTLLGASIGLMNIMLVSVTERTKEIGVRKALGATRGNVLTQFMTEAIVICLLGGIVGIIFGIIIGFLVTQVASASFVIPWNWMTLGIIVCVIVGVVSGLYPALKASRMDPIESLRYE